MSGTGAGDELAILIASFVEEVRPFLAGIRRGVAGIFAVPRDGQAIITARGYLGTLAASAAVLDLPAARQVGELAQLVNEAFGAAERDGVPSESRAPLLMLVDDLEAQLDSLLTGDERGRERLNNGYRLLEQVLRTVEAAETPSPAAAESLPSATAETSLPATTEIDLEDLLLTLPPTAPAPVSTPTPAVEPAAAATAESEPAQTELVLLAEDEVAPIEWGKKEAILWQKRGWDESQAAYGNTGWIFLDEDETEPLAHVEDAPTPLAMTAGEPPDAQDGAALSAEDATTWMGVAGDTVDIVVAEITHTGAGDPPSIARLDADRLEEAALLAFSGPELDAFLALDQPAQEAYLTRRVDEMTVFASALGLAVETPTATTPPAAPAAAMEAALPTAVSEPPMSRAAPSPAPTPVAEPPATDEGRLRDVAAVTSPAPPEPPAPPADLEIDARATPYPQAGEEESANDGNAPAALLGRRQVGGATTELFTDDAGDDQGDPDDALPDLTPAIEATFARLSESDMATFLTLDGDAAMAFLQSRSAAASANDTPTPASRTAADGEDLLLSTAPDGMSWAADETPGADGTRLSSLALDPEIRDTFLQEARELLVEWAVVGARFRRAPADRAVMADLRRIAHTLKGAANMMGFTALRSCGRLVEDMLALLDQYGIAAAPSILDFVDRGYALSQLLSSGATVDPRDFAGELEALTADHAALTAAVRAGAFDAPAADAAPGEGMLVPAGPTADVREPVQPAAAPAPGTEAPSIKEDLAADDELLEVFTQEAEGHLAAFNRAVIALDRRPDDLARLAEAKRVIHTLKGAAAALDYPVTAALCHTIEDLFETLDGHGGRLSPEILALFFESGEALEGLIRGIAAGRGEESAGADTLRARYEAFLVPPSAAPDAPDRPAPDLTTIPADAAEAIARGQLTPAPRGIRVDIAHLDNLLHLIDELVSNRTSQEQHLARLGRTIAELLLSIDRLRHVGFQLERRDEAPESPRGEDQAHGPAPAAHPDDGVLRPVASRERGADAFDDLELDRHAEAHQLSRELVEIVAAISAAGGELEVLRDNIDQTFGWQGRIAADLQDRMREVRLVPLGNIASRLYRAVRGVATKRGRQAELVIEGETVEIEKILLEELTDPLLHLVRNAVDHGIEAPATRLARGKPAIGTVRLIAAREGDEATIRVSDDGAGVDIDAVLDKARARGVIQSRDALSHEAALDLIFLPGFSTSATVSDISGRGVGLDMVRTNITRLQGSIAVQSIPGSGTTFTIRLPIMLAVTREGGS